MNCDLKELRLLWDEFGYPYPDMERSKALRSAWKSWSISILGKEIRNGTIPKAKDSGLFCVDCGAKAQIWEHRDYTKPLQIEPCCMKCNSRRGKAFIPDYFPDPTEGQLRFNRGSLLLLKRGRKPPK